jgi:hypothetical protein
MSRSSREGFALYRNLWWALSLSGLVGLVQFPMAWHTEPNNNERLVVVGMVSMLAQRSAKDARTGMRIELL